MIEITNNLSDNILSDHNTASWPLFNNLSLAQEKIKLILDKLSNLWIKKILIVDDTSENISMGKQYFDNIPLQIDYASNANDAIQKIQNAYVKSKYDLILTDLEMETSKSWFDVAREWFAHQADTFIVTGINYNRSHNDAHGPNTNILWLTFSVKSKKNEEWTRESLFDAVIDHLWWKWKHLHNSLSRYNKFVWKPSYELADTYISWIN